MELRPPDPPPWLPALRQAVAPPAVREAPQAAPPPPAPPGPRFGWRRVTRSPRGAAGLAILAAALLLWPFADWTALPWLAGLGVLVLLRLLRLDGLLRGWALPVAGLVVVAGLMMSTTPWAWALAASIGVLLAGLAQLPWWRLAAVGAVLCVVSGGGFAFATLQSAQEEAVAQARTQLQNRGQLGAVRANGVLPALLNRIAQASPGAVCDNLIAEQARAPFAASTGSPDCTSAVRSLSALVLDRQAYARAKAPSEPLPDGGLAVDACVLTWGGGIPLGPQLGRLTIGRGTGATFVVTGFRAC